MKSQLDHTIGIRIKNRIARWALLTVVVGAMCCVNGSTTYAAPWDTQLQVLADALTGTTGQILATLGIAGVGVLFLAGRIAIQHAALVVLGIAFVFGASSIVGFFG